MQRSPAPYPHRFTLTLLLVSIFLGTACLLTPAATPAPATDNPLPATEPAPPTATLEARDAEQWMDLAYASLSGAQKLDLYVPAGTGPFPLIIYIHGGGFRQGDKALPFDRELLEAHLTNGYALASLNYRLSGEAPFPAAVQDVKTAVRWLRAHASEYRLDSRRFAAWGTSAGGNLAAMLGTSCGAESLEGAELGHPDHSSCVQAVVDFFGPIDFLKMDEQFEGTACRQDHLLPTSAESQYLAGPVLERIVLAQAANPISYVSPDDAPFFIEHGTADCTVPYQQSQQLYDALAPVIGEENVTLVLLDGAGHGGIRFFTEENLESIREFLDSHMPP